MHVLKRNPWLFGLGALLAVLVVHGRVARADITTDRPGSVVIFPKVISDGTRDTLIQLTNTGNMPMEDVHCTYVNASGACSVSDAPCNLRRDCPDPATETCDHQCLEHDFDIGMLTGQQPTMWRVSTGRNALNLTDGLPINAPAQGTRFTGELKCTVLDSSDSPVVQNYLKGEATIVDLATGDPSIYNALSVVAGTGVTADPCVQNGSGVPICEFPLDGGHFNACPADLVVDHIAEGLTETSGPLTGATVSTELTLIPCTEDLEDQIIPRGSAQLDAWNEFEYRISFGITFDCWYNRRLADIAGIFGSVPGTSVLGAPLDTEFLRTRITPPASATTVCMSGDNANLTCTTDGDCPNAAVTPGGTVLGCRPYTGLLGVAEEFQTLGTMTGSEAFNLQLEGTRPGDLMVLPIGQ